MSAPAVPGTTGQGSDGRIVVDALTERFGGSAAVDLLPLGGGVAVLLGWTVVLVGLGLATSLRRDVT